MIHLGVDTASKLFSFAIVTKLLNTSISMQSLFVGLDTVILKFDESVRTAFYCEYTHPLKHAFRQMQ
jgi:hypothetical protein